MLIRFFWRLLCFLFPWLVLLINDNPGGALVALIMQATLLGWIPATLWALKSVYENQPAFEKMKSRK